MIVNKTDINNTVTLNVVAMVLNFDTSTRTVYSYTASVLCELNDETFLCKPNIIRKGYEDEKCYGDGNFNCF